ncbi:carcinoembryonic antigen-related cell adhesion molecule 6-like [Crotalus tigris]|uniref:carcinoembryonic antigen-related cell adhesion molecule 6-like n=1 Tax=Crotalus tigris TaxID=88082 RepID=UPI00192F22E8|nr:carcinoembryonic antigen-related cell adhesion molecule 6-like [Crotalus tigris]
MQTRPPYLMNGVHSILGWRSSWWMVLWAATLFHLAGAEETVQIKSDPPNPMEKLDVRLDPPKPLDEIVYCSWSRGLSPETMGEIGIRFRPPINGSTQGPQYTKREDIYTNCSLVIRGLRFQDSVNYMLIEGGPGLFYVGYATITVVDFLPKPNVTANPSNSILEWSSVCFTCNVPKDLTIKWFKDGKLYTNESHLSDDNQTLYIPNVSRSDAGEYQCQVTNNTSTRISDVLNLHVLYGPDTPEIQPTQRYYNEHTNVVLTCSADSSSQPLYVWFHNGKQLDTGPKLLLGNFTADKTGSYICQAENDLLHEKRNSSNLEIYLEESRVSNVTIAGTPEPIEGRPVSLNCTSRGDNVSYYWTNGGQVVHAGGHISLTNNNQTLELNPGYRSDAGDYICHGYNSISSNESTPYSLGIIYGPDPPIINETIDVPKAQIKLTCKAVMFPPANCTWFFNGVELVDVILVREISPENSGNYTCSVINMVSIMSRNTTLEIDMKKKFKNLKQK